MRVAPVLPILLVLLIPAWAATWAADDPQSLEREVAALFQAHDYAKAEAACAQLCAIDPKQSSSAYNLACAQARQGKTDAALKSLAHAVELGYGDAAHTQEDDDLTSLRTRPEFAKLLEQMRAMPYADGSPIEPGAPIAGLRTIERAPPGGLRYRLRLSEQATADKPHRLVLWLHPSGGSGDNAVEPLATSLAAHGYALAVFTQKQYRGWTSDELGRLAPTVADLGKQAGLDATRPILMGFSAGGQAALMMWQDNPTAFGGLMTSAAYPVQVQKGMAPMPPPTGEAAKATPIFALVGGADQNGAGERTWRNVEPEWSKAGVPLTLRVVPGRGHEFLFGGADWQAALTWLDQLPASKAGKQGKADKADQADKPTPAPPEKPAH
jgi:predicted esterase